MNSSSGMIQPGVAYCQLRIGPVMMTVNSPRCCERSATSLEKYSCSGRIRYSTLIPVSRSNSGIAGSSDSVNGCLLRPIVSDCPAASRQLILAWR